MLEPIKSALYSQYIIDGTRYDVPPAELLYECLQKNADRGDLPVNQSDVCDIVDESREPSLSSFRYDPKKVEDYSSLVDRALTIPRPFNMICPEHFTRLRIAGALIDFIWKEGHFRLGDLCVGFKWMWDMSPVGNMAAFYKSVETLNTYLYDLGVRVCGYEVTENQGGSYMDVMAFLSEANNNEEDGEWDENFLFKSSPYESRHPRVGFGRKCPVKTSCDPDRWIIYIPFDPCRFRIGGSLLATVLGDRAGMAPEVSDPDYFIDCYEVVRELIEDGIISAGVTVAEGGIAAGLRKMSSGCGMDTDFGGIMSSYQETNPVNIIFGEVPGVLVEIEDYNFDYFDSQMLLQDVAYYPIGHPDPDRVEQIFGSSDKTNIASILASLIGQASEGED